MVCLVYGLDEPTKLCMQSLRAIFSSLSSKDKPHGSVILRNFTFILI